jgi:hypothetical protein
VSAPSDWFRTRRSRLISSAVGMACWLTCSVLAFMDYREWSAVFFAATVAWMLSVFAVMMRDDWERYKIRRDYWDDLEAEFDRIDGQDR